MKNANQIVSKLYESLFKYVNDPNEIIEGHAVSFPNWGSVFDSLLYKSKSTIVPCSKGMNFFLLYFWALRKNDQYGISNNTYNWSDIENQLYLLLSKYSKLILYAIHFINYNKSHNPYKTNSSLIMGKLVNEINDLTYNLKNFTPHYAKLNIIIMSSCAFLSLVNFNFKRSNLYEFLFSQLKIFEKDFGNYINVEETSNPLYIANVKRIINYIKQNNGNKQNILSFNYTDLTLTKGCKPVRNVHSTFQYEPIIGIDSSRNNAYKQPYYMFTKTYRTLNLVNNHSNDIHKDEYTKNILPAKSKIGKIIFYGHSLGIEDYSYFMAIFDYYHIYDSNVQLIFYYNNHDGKDERKNQYISIFKLMNHYGSFIHHGENLLHKLILENRIHIKYLHVKTEK